MIYAIGCGMGAPRNPPRRRCECRLGLARGQSLQPRTSGRTSTVCTMNCNGLMFVLLEV